MAKLEFNRVLFAAIIVGSVGIIAGLSVVVFSSSKTQRLTLAAGSSSGESYILGNAVKKVVERHYPKIRT